MGFVGCSSVGITNYSELHGVRLVYIQFPLQHEMAHLYLEKPSLTNAFRVFLSIAEAVRVKGHVYGEYG